METHIMRIKLLTHILVIAFGVQFLFVGCQGNPGNQRIDKLKSSLKDHIGERLKISNILDTAGNQVDLDFTKSDLTVVDFWFNSCPPCIKELNQFANVLVGKEQKVSVISISINQPWLWNKTRKEHNGRFAFFKNKLSNWTHYVLQTAQSEKLKNELSVDRVVELQKTYNVAFFPAYFVVDRNGIILTRPESAVNYIKNL